MAKQPAVKHVLRAQQFDRPLLEQLFQRSDEFRQALDNPAKRHRLREQQRGRTLFNIFYEPSTRTRFSFGAAAGHLGMRVMTTENASEFSSAAKGETLEDSIRTLCQYSPDVIVLRHHETGAAARAAAVSTVSVINAGDGTGEHPTQSLLDLYTIQQELGEIDGKKVLIGGDLAYGRTGRSLARMLSNFQDVAVIFVAPDEVRMGDDVKDFLKKRAVPYSETDDLESVIGEADVIYWTRLQWERFEDKQLFNKLKDRYTIGKPHLKRMKPSAILMHPLPRIGEIDPTVDADRRAAYFRQAGNGMLIRMALLEWVLP